MVAALLGSTEPVIRETAVWIVGRHPDWGDALAGYLGSRLSAESLTDAEVGELEEAARPLCESSLRYRNCSVKRWRMEKFGVALVPARCCAAGDKACSQTARALPPAWIDALTKVLAGDNIERLASDRPVEQASRAIRLSPRKVPRSEVHHSVTGTRRSKWCPGECSPECPGGHSGRTCRSHAGDFRLPLRDDGIPEQEVLLRSTAADVLARSKLTLPQLAALTETFQSAGPLEADRLLPAYKEAADETVP